MARPIKETPILFGNDARNFETRMHQERIETESERAERLKAYTVMMSIFQEND